MLIDRYVFREIAWPSALGLLVYTAIFLVNQFFRLADQWVAGTLTLEDVGLSLVYYVPSILTLALPTSVLLGILIGFSRLSADSEITALRTTGVSYYRLLLPTAVLAVVGFSLTAAIYIEAVPWANTRVVETVTRAAKRTDLNREIQPNVWVPLSENTPGLDVALYARGIDTSGEEPWLVDVDVLRIDNNLRTSEHITAKRLHLSRVLTSESTARIKLQFQGLRQMRWKPDDPKAPTIVEASEGERLLPETRIPGTRNPSSQRGLEKNARLQTLDELEGTLRSIDMLDEADRLEKTDPARTQALRAMAGGMPVVKQARERIRRLVIMEKHKKIAIPMACLVFAVAGMPLGIATRRGGRPASFLVSIGVVLVWWMVLSGGTAWVMAGKLSPQIGAWLPNIVLGVAGLNLLVGQRRQQAVGVYRALRDGQLLGATAFIVLSALLLHERLAMPAGKDGRAPYSYWVPTCGLVLLLGHVAFVIWRDSISKRIAAFTEAFRRPRRRIEGERSSEAMDEAVEAVDVEVETDVAETPEPAPAAAPVLPPELSAAHHAHRAAVLQKLRNALIFAQLALLAFVLVQAASSGSGVVRGFLDALVGWEGAALVVLLAGGVALQRAGAGLFSTMDWWIVTAFARVLTLVLMSLVVIYCVVQYIELADQMLKNKTPLVRLLDYYAWLSPQIVIDILPIAAMVAAIITFGVMTKFNETTALRCGGISVYRVVFPVLLLGVMLSGISFVLHDYVLPTSNERADEVRRKITGASPRPPSTQRGFLMAESGRALYQFRSVFVSDEPRATQPPLLTALTVLRQDASGQIHDLWIARDATFVDGAWRLRAGWHGEVQPDRNVVVKQFAASRIDGMEPPDYFVATRRDPEQMTFGEFSRYIDDQESAGRPTGALQVTLQKKLAFPAAAMVLVLVGVPFAFTTGRRGSLYGLGVSVILAVVYLAAVALFTALGSAEYLHPMAAAWAPNALFAVAGLFFLLHVRT